MMRIWLWPVLIGVLSTLGLTAGLVSEGAGDWLSWLAGSGSSRHHRPAWFVALRRAPSAARRQRYGCNISASWSKLNGLGSERAGRLLSIRPSPETNTSRSHG